MSAPIYIPKVKYDLTGGVNYAQFVSPQKVAKAVVQEDGFFRQPQKASDSIRIFNASGFDLFPTLDEYVPERDPETRSIVERFRQVEKDAIYLKHGCASHFVVGQTHHRLHLRQKVVSERTGCKEVSSNGYCYEDLINTTLVIKDDSDIEYALNVDFIPNSDNCGETIIFNHSKREVEWYVTVTSTAYAPTVQDINIEKQSRKNDLGPAKQESGTLLANSHSVLCLPTQWWWIHGILPIKKENSRIKSVDTIPSSKDYEDCGYVKAHNGQFVVFLKSDNGNGIRVIALDEASVKKVAESLVVNTSYDK
jgi:hypothetical protein